MKKLICSLLICAMALATGLHAQSVADLGKIKFVGVKSMRIDDFGDQRCAYLKLQIANSSSNELVVADGKLDISFRAAEIPKGKDTEPVFVDVPLALSKPRESTHLSAIIMPGKEEAILPKGSLMSAGVGTVEIRVFIGQADQSETYEKLITLFNLVAGEQQRLIQIVLKSDGNLRFGVNIGKATAYQELPIRWVLTPKVMDRVIFTE